MLIFMIILLNHYVPHFVQLKAGAADKYDCKTSEGAIYPTGRNDKAV